MADSQLIKLRALSIEKESSMKGFFISSKPVARPVFQGWLNCPRGITWYKI